MQMIHNVVGLSTILLPKDSRQAGNLHELGLTKGNENSCFFVMPEVVVGHPCFKSGFPLTDCGNDGFEVYFRDNDI